MRRGARGAWRTRRVGDIAGRVEFLDLLWFKDGGVWAFMARGGEKRSSHCAIAGVCNDAHEGRSDGGREEWLVSRRAKNTLIQDANLGKLKCYWRPMCLEERGMHRVLLSADCGVPAGGP